MARFRSRHIILCTIIILLIWIHVSYDAKLPYLQSFRHNANRDDDVPSGGTESMASYMNDQDFVPRIAANKSSFDWSTVDFKYPPPLNPKLPTPFTSRPRIQHVFEREHRGVKNEIDRRRKSVKAAFTKVWESYRKHAWMKDALKPISGRPVNQFSGWAATLVDSLDTLWMLGMRDEFWEAVGAVTTIDFGQSTSNSVNMFETNIRYLGGLLAAYDLSESEVLKKKAVEVGDLLYAGFNTENRMPVDFIGFGQAKSGGGLPVEQDVVSASPGTITLEFARLSQVTGDSKYYAAVSNVMDVFQEQQNQTKLPGMWPMRVSMARKDLVSGYQFTLSGNADSLYEYLPKAHALLGSADASSAKYEAMSKYFMDTAMKNLFLKPMTPDNADILISGNCDVLSDGPRLDPESEHLSCFIGGLFALGGRLFQNQSYLDTGAKLAHGCAYAYQSFPSGLMPERYNMIICPDPNDCRWNEELWVSELGKRPEYKEHLPKGFTTAKDPRYILRPEAIESVFILWRISGDTTWRDMAWDMFQAVSKATETELGNAAVGDVTIVGSDKVDYMESFWLAETLKYFYLCFADPGLISLDDFVFNTEAHPFKLAK